MNLKFKMHEVVTVYIIAFSTSFATDITNNYKLLDASQIVANDLFPEATRYAMPATCDLNDKDSIARGEYMFHNINSQNAKGTIPKGLLVGDGYSIKEYGNCVACHNIENAHAPGNIGPSLVDYKKIFIDSGVRNTEFLYQKIADSRIDNLKTHMTINLTTGLNTEQEICDYTAYILSNKLKIRN